MALDKEMTPRKVSLPVFATEETLEEQVAIYKKRVLEDGE